MNKVIPIILSGGSGSRLWPLSRADYPKQYLPLLSNQTLLQTTLKRLKSLENLSTPIIVCNQDHRFIVHEQCKEVNILNPTIILEPVGRNSAPAIAVAALKSKTDFDDAILLVMSADHMIKDDESFHESIMTAIKQAEEGKLVTLGVFPTEISTEYGYIKTSEFTAKNVYKVQEFVEKPDFQNAKSFIDQGGYYWNAGIFLFRADILIKELSKFQPEIISTARQSLNNSSKDMQFIRLERESFATSPNISIDYALMEKSKNVVAVILKAEWKDVGRWQAIFDLKERDKHNNFLEGDIFTYETFNSFVKSDSRLIATVGIENLFIVDTPDVTLIASSEKVDNVKKIVKTLEDQNRTESIFNKKVFRPWGWYDVIQTGDNFQVKKLFIKPRARLSLQSHKYRSEHWVVVKGIAKIFINNEYSILNEGESTFIPRGEKHSLENENEQILEIIEVQIGSYLGEDDIQRFEDLYGRSELKF